MAERGKSIPLIYKNMTTQFPGGLVQAGTLIKGGGFSNFKVNIDEHFLYSTKSAFIQNARWCVIAGQCLR